VSGDPATEYTRQELAADEAMIRQAALIRNDVLRRALAIAACEYADLDGAVNGPAVRGDEGIGLMICWVMRACEELGLGHPGEGAGPGA
jgi:hypothetical protein